MFPTIDTDHKTKDRKLAAVAYLRENADANRHRLTQVKNILNGEYHDQSIDISKETINADFSVSAGEKSLAVSFRNRFVFCLIITILLYAAQMDKSSSAVHYVQEIKSVISVDYSDNLFDFIEQIPYTLDYEKINVKR